jgi:RNA polymerase sigma-70 factor (ECF subfamily)
VKSPEVNGVAVPKDAFEGDKKTACWARNRMLAATGFNVEVKSGGSAVSNQEDTEVLISRVRSGDAVALDLLLMRHQQRLRSLIAFRMDRRLSARFDPSDVVQSTLAVAAQRLPAYLREAPLPFYPWLRRLALERLIDFQRKHLLAAGRSVRREDGHILGRSDESVAGLARGLAAGSSPSARLERHEMQARVAAALSQLGRGDREVLVLRHLEGMSTAEIAGALHLTEAAVKSRHFRAIERLRCRLAGESAGGKS